LAAGSVAELLVSKPFRFPRFWNGTERTSSKSAAFR
jgi:hypothetical protein